MKQDLAINEQITDKEIQLIDENGVQLGVMSPSEAMVIAEERNMDLVKVAPALKPPVCKIMDYGKFRYEQSRKEKEAKKKQRVVDVKEIRLSATIDTHDFEFKMRNAKRFLEDGDKVKAKVKFKGRELNNTAFGANVLKKFAEGLSEVGTMEREPRLEGRSMMIMINPKNG